MQPSRTRDARPSLYGHSCIQIGMQGESSSLVISAQSHIELNYLGEACLLTSAQPMGTGRPQPQLPPACMLPMSTLDLHHQLASCMASTTLLQGFAAI